MRDDTMFSNWKERYLCIEGDKLFYFDSEHDLEHLGFIELRLITHIGKRVDSKKSIYKWIIELHTKDRVVLMDCSSEDNMDKWIISLKSWQKYFGDDWEKVHDTETSPQGGSDGEPGASEKENVEANGKENGEVVLTLAEREKEREHLLRSGSKKKDLSTSDEKDSIVRSASKRNHVDSSDRMDVIRAGSKKLGAKSDPESPAEHLIRSASSRKRDKSEPESFGDKERSDALLLRSASKKHREKSDSDATEKERMDILLKSGSKREIKRLENIITQQINEKKQCERTLEEQLKLMQEHMKAMQEKVSELELVVSCAHAENEELTKRNKSLEIEILDYKEKLAAQTQQLYASMKSFKPLHITNDTIVKEQEETLLLKQRLFFSLAMNAKMSGIAPNLNINSLYQKAIVNKVPSADWDAWIYQHSLDPDCSF